MYKRFQKDGSNFLSLYDIQNSSFLFHSFKKIKDTTIAIVNNETLEAKFLRSWSVRNTRSNFLSLYDIKIQLKFSFPFISIKIKDTTIAIVNNNKTFKEIFEKLEYKKYKILGIIPKILNAKNFDTSNSVCVCVCAWALPMRLSSLHLSSMNIQRIDVHRIHCTCQHHTHVVGV